MAANPNAAWAGAGFDPLFQAAGLRWGLDWRLLKAIARRESSFNPEAMNPADPSYGLMQVSLRTARALGFTGDPVELLQPATGIEWGTRTLADIKRRHTNVADQLAVYNGGEKGGIPRAFIPAEMRPADADAVKRYVSDVLRFYDQYRGAAPVHGPPAPAEGLVEAGAAPGAGLRGLLPWVIAAALGFLIWRMFRG